jgi:thioredoxin-related protein
MMRIGLILLCMLFGALAHAAPIDNKDGFWSEWNEATFERAAREKKFVVLSLQAWWCRWCFIMNRETWRDPGVRKILKDNFIPVHVDQDSRPDISQRYEDFGWPATIILNADGTEIVKLRGYYSPQYFIPVLEETVRDPSPVVYPNHGGGERPRTLATSLSDSQRKSILNFIDNEAWNEEFGGWSRSKFVDGSTLGWALRRAKQGDLVQASRIERTLKGMLSMIDRDYGAMGQENRNLDWSDPVRTYPMFAQEAGLTAYSQAAMLFSDPVYRVAADRIYGFLKNTMAAADGGFYASLGLGEGVPGIDRKRTRANPRKRSRRYLPIMMQRALLKRAISRSKPHGGSWPIAPAPKAASGMRKPTSPGHIFPTALRWPRRCWRCTDRLAAANG